jgi:hypothetical protein
MTDSIDPHLIKRVGDFFITKLEESVNFCVAKLIYATCFDSLTCASGDRTGSIEVKPEATLKYC